MEDQNIEGKDRETGALSKKSLRQHIRQRKARHTDEELVALSQPIVEAVLADPRFQEAQTVLLYHSLPDEVDTGRLLAELALASADFSGKTILLPRVTGETDMELRVYTGPYDMTRGAFGIMEPSGALFTDYSQITLAIVPGMAFDCCGHRLGRGKGYYDRFLPLLPQAYKIGVCFPFQLVDSVPTVPTDVVMDEVVC